MMEADATCSDMVEKYKMNLPAYPENGDQIVEL